MYHQNSFTPKSKFLGNSETAPQGHLPRSLQESRSKRTAHVVLCCAMQAGDHALAKVVVDEERATAQEAKKLDDKSIQRCWVQVSESIS